MSEERAREIIKEAAVAHAAARGASELHALRTGDRGAQRVFTDTAAGVADQHGLTLTAALLRVTSALQMNPKVCLIQAHRWLRWRISVHRDVQALYPVTRSFCRPCPPIPLPLLCRTTPFFLRPCKMARCLLGQLPELLRQTSVSLSVAHEDAVRAALVREAGG